jgi:hypothetical protein
VSRVSRRIRQPASACQSSGSLLRGDCSHRTPWERDSRWRDSKRAGRQVARSRRHPRSAGRCATAYRSDWSHVPVVDAGGSERSAGYGRGRSAARPLRVRHRAGSEGNREQPTAHLVHQESEGVPVPTASPLEEVSIHLDPCNHRAWSARTPHYECRRYRQRSTWRWRPALLPSASRAELDLLKAQRIATTDGILGERCALIEVPTVIR